MAYALRHSHIAIRKPLPELARSAGADLCSGEDELGDYRYFDLQLGAGSDEEQTVRFASHHGDAMVHLLAEKISRTRQLAEALWAVGVGRAAPRRQAELSISRDQDGLPVRDEQEIWQHLLDLGNRAMPVEANGQARLRSTPHKWSGSPPQKTPAVLKTLK